MRKSLPEFVKVGGWKALLIHTYEVSYSPVGNMKSTGNLQRFRFYDRGCLEALLSFIDMAYIVSYNATHDVNTVFGFLFARGRARELFCFCATHTRTAAVVISPNRMFDDEGRLFVAP